MNIILCQISIAIGIILVFIGGMGWIDKAGNLLDDEVEIEYQRVCSEAYEDLISESRSSTDKYTHGLVSGRGYIVIDNKTAEIYAFRLPEHYIAWSLNNLNEVERMNDSRLTEDEAYEAAFMMTNYTWAGEGEIALELAGQIKKPLPKPYTKSFWFVTGPQETKE